MRDGCRFDEQDPDKNLILIKDAGCTFNNKVYENVCFSPPALRKD
jgi:hypothetical protein